MGNQLESKVYGLYKNNELVYVGCSVNLTSRLKEHAYDKDFDTHMIFYQSIDREVALTVERELIENHWPKYNKHAGKKSGRPLSGHGRIRFTTIIEPDLRDKIKIIAIMSNMPIHQVFNEAIRQYVNKHTAKDKINAVHEKVNDPKA